MNFDEFKKLWKEKNNKIQQVAKGRHVSPEKIHSFWDNLQIVVEHKAEAKKIMQNKSDIQLLVDFYSDFSKHLEAMETIPEHIFQRNVTQVIRQVYPEAYKIMPYSQFSKKAKYIAERVQNFLGQSTTQMEKPVEPQTAEEPVKAKKVEPQKANPPEAVDPVSEEKPVQEAPKEVAKSVLSQAQTTHLEEKEEPTTPEINQEETAKTNEPVEPPTNNVKEDVKEEKKEEQPPMEKPKKAKKREEENVNMLEGEMMKQESREQAQEDKPEEQPKETPKVEKDEISENTPQKTEEPKAKPNEGKEEKEAKPFNWTMILIFGGIAVAAIFFVMHFMKKREKVQDNVFIPPQSVSSQSYQQPIAQTPPEQQQAPVAQEETPQNMDEYAKNLISKVQSGKKARRPEEIWGNRS